MKKTLVMGLGLVCALAFTSCKSSESAYKKAYDKAKAAENYQQPVTTPVVEATPAPVVVNNTASQAGVVDNIAVRQEKVTLVNGSGLNAFSVVCGSFGLKANAEGLQGRLKNAGYDAQIAYNDGNKMYRVIASTFADKAAAAQSRDQLRATYPDAWLLYNK